LLDEAATRQKKDKNRYNFLAHFRAPIKGSIP